MNISWTRGSGRLQAGAVALLLLVASAALAQVSSHSTSYRYDLGRRVTGIIQPDPDDTGPLRFPAVRHTYNSAGLLTTVEKGELATWQSDSVAPSSWSGFTVHSILSYTYDDAGRRRSELLSSSGTGYALSQYSYDAVDRLECRAVRMNPGAFTSLIASGSACGLGPQGSYGADRIVRYTYDAWDRPRTEVRAYGTSLQQTYADYSYTGRHLTGIVDAKQNRQSFTYDGLGRREFWYFPSKTTPGQASASDYEQYGYDNNGNLRTLRKRDTSVISYTYDALNRITLKELPGSYPDVSYGYDLRGLQGFARFTSTGQGVTQIYDGFGRQTQSIVNLGGTSRTVFTDFDANGNRTRVTHPDGQYFEYTHDRLNRLTRIAENATNTLISNVYNSRGALWTTTRGSAISTTTYLYDPVLRLQSLSHDMDGAGTAGDVTFGYGFNPASQITSRTLSNDLYANVIGNLETRSYVSNGLNQYTQISAAASVAPTYDANGNLTSDGATTYGYDVENRLTSATGAKTGAYSFDPKGRLHQANANNENRQFLYEGDRLIGEYDAAGNLLHRYVHGNSVDEPLVWYTGANVSTTNRRYYHSDRQGSVVAVSSGSGNTLGRNSYDAYGAPMAPNLSRFQYTGQTILPELGVYYYKARIYDPTLGRFMQTDPIGYEDDLNLYAYVRNDPLNLIDPSGKNAAAGCAVGSIVAGPVGCAVGALVGTAVLAGVILSVPGDTQQVPNGASDASSGTKSTDTAANEPKAAGQSEASGPAPTADAKPSNTNPYSGPVSEPVTVVDGNGNAIPVSAGEQISTSPNGDYQQVRDSAGNPTGVRLDRGGHRTHSDPSAKGPHGHVPGVTRPDGNPHLPIKCPNSTGNC